MSGYSSRDQITLHLTLPPTAGIAKRGFKIAQKTVGVPLFQHISSISSGQKKPTCDCRGFIHQRPKSQHFQQRQTLFLQKSEACQTSDSLLDSLPEPDEHHVPFHEPVHHITSPGRQNSSEYKDVPDGTVGWLNAPEALPCRTSASIRVRSKNCLAIAICGSNPVRLPVTILGFGLRNVCHHHQARRDTGPRRGMLSAPIHPAFS